MCAFDMQSGRSGSAAGWSDEIEEIIASDLTAGLSYVTPAGGAVVTAIAPVGLRDRDAGTVSFTTSRGFGRKLERIRENPRVALAYHAREHGFSDRPQYVLVQGDAQAREPDRATLEAIGPQVERFLGPRMSGLFWDRWLAAYYADRVVVDVLVRRILSWPTLDCSGDPAVHGEPLPSAAASQREPAKGAAPRVPLRRAAKRLGKLPYRLLAVTGGDGYPLVLLCDVGETHPQGVELTIHGLSVGIGGRRAGVLAHSYRPRLIGLQARQCTGWLQVPGDRSQPPATGLYAPHTEQGFQAPANKTLLLLVNGLLAHRGLRRVEAQGARKAA